MRSGPAIMEWMSRPTKSILAIALLCAGLFPVREARAVCKEPLPAADLHALDTLAIADPVAADRKARAALDATRDAARRAQLLAILADAHNTTGDDDASLQDIREGRAQLALAGPFEGADRVGLRLALVEADAAHNRQEMLAAVSGLEQWRDVAQRQPIGRACLLLVRSRVLSRLGMHEQSAREGLEAHAIATQSGSEDAISETHFQLANAFRRAGMFEQASPHVDASIALERSRRQPAALSGALYLKAGILGDSGRIGEARDVMLESRRISLDQDDRISVAFENQGLCEFELLLGNPGAARALCGESRLAFAKAGREDMVALTEVLEARIDMAMHRPAKALATLEKVLRNDDATMPPFGIARAWRVRADAHGALGQTAGAVKALRKYLELEEATQQLQRSLAAALTLAQFESQAQEVREARLNREVRERREQASAASASRQKAWALVAASAAIIGLLLALLAASRRNARVLRRQEALLKAASELSSDAIALLTADGRVRLANRDLFGQGGPPPQHGLLIDAVPASLKDGMREVLALLLEDGIEVERNLRIESPAAKNGWRDIELRAFPIFQSSRLIGATLRTTDVTARRAVERAALEWLERQRERAGDGLHEGLAQELAGVSMRLGAMATAQRSGRTVAPDTLEASIAQLSGAIAATRNLASELSPMAGGRGSLQDALARLAAEAGRRSGAPVHFAGTWDPLPDLGRAAELIYRIAELALLAPGKESVAAATTLGVELQPEGIQLMLEAQSGFQSLDAQILQIIRHLATLLGASTHIQQLEQQGWRLRVTVPRSGLAR
jgi:signal transduction histidine kinase